MGIKKYWFSSSSQSTAQTIRLGRSNTKPHDQSYPPGSYDGSKTAWRALWRKIREHKKKVFRSPVTMEGIYDPDTYLQNFDQGAGRMEPDNLCRSFSAKFADPYKILPPKHLVD